MVNYNIAYDNAMAEEGGYSNNPNDAGGETYRGIARNFHPSWVGWPIIDSIKTKTGFDKVLDNDLQLQKLVKDFYKTEFWDKISGDSLIYQNIANELLECAINMGTLPAVKIFQKSINLIFNTSLTEDGYLGPKTITAYTLKMASNVNTFNANKAVLAAMLCLRAQRYVYITEQKLTNQVFFFGWIKRSFKMISW